MPTEDDTCRKFVVRKPQAAGWDNEPYSIAEQRYFTAGRIVSQGPTARRRPGKLADHLLRYTRDFPLAVAEAKAAHKHAADGLQQAKDYAPEACEVINDPLEKCAADGELHFTLPDVLKVLPVSHHGDVKEIIGKLGGAHQLRNAVDQLQSLIYAA